MARPLCLFHFSCGGTAEPGEHVFPAALGGRRTSGNLSCKACNNALSVLDNALACDLRFLNAMLGVVPDRQKTTVPAEVEDEYGRPLKFSLGRGLQSPLEVRELGTIDGERNFAVLASTRAELEKFIAASRSSGKKLKLNEFQERRTLFSQPLRARSGFGGPETFRAVTRLALHYLSEADPDLARHDALRPTKEWILGHSIGDRAWLDYSSALAALGDWKDEPTHSLIVARTESGEVLGHVSFFGVFRVTALLGHAVGPRFCRRVRVYPLRANRGRDVVEDTDAPALASAPSFPAERDPQADDGIVRGMARAQRYWEQVGRRRAAEALEKDLALAVEQPPPARQAAVWRALDERCQPVYDHLVGVVTALRARLHDSEAENWLRGFCDAVLATSLADDWGISPVARYLVRRITDHLVDELDGDLEAGLPSVPDLEDVLFGPRGTRAVCEVLRQVLTVPE